MLLGPLAAVLLGAQTPTIFAAGDSTAAATTTPEDQQGWAEPFAAYFDPAKVKIANRARGGRSSRTFITEGLWAGLIAEVKPGDIVLIQFGHNDAGAINEEPPGSSRPLRARGSLPGLGEEKQEIDNVVTKQHEVVHTYGFYMRQMIAETKARGATPIVLSLTVRNEWKDGKVERGSGRYGEWSKAIAAAAGVPFVDVTNLVADRFEALGQEAVAAFYPHDHTHFNLRGADVQAKAVVDGLGRLKPNPIGDLVSPAATR